MWDLPNFYTFISKNYGECQRSFVNNEFNTLKMDYSTPVQMLIIQKMWKNSLIYSSINVNHSIVMCVSIYINKCNMQHLNNGFNNFKIDGSSHVKMSIVQKMWKTLLNH
jgi:hypothetical protein